jgi:glycerol uptake facilitator protein
MTSPFLGEFLGTAVLIVLGDGVVAGVLLKRSKAEAGGWMVITAGWAFAVMAGVFTAVACGSSDAHLNPAVTLGFAVRNGDFSKFAPYLAAQMLGALLGATLVWLHYWPTGGKRLIPPPSWDASALPPRYAGFSPTC